MRRFYACLILLLALSLCAGCTQTQPDKLSSIELPPVSTEPSAPPELAQILMPEPTPVPESDSGISPAPAPLALEGHLICVDPGHCVTPLSRGGYRELVSPLSDETKPLYTTGTQGKHTTEEKVNLAVGLKLRDALVALGAEVIMTREVSDITISGIERCDIANRAGVDVCVRIHCDGSVDKSIHGVSVLIPSGKLLGTPDIKDESGRLGQLMVDAVAEKTGAKNLGTILRTDLTGFNFSEVPSVLIEMGFMTNAEEDAQLETEEYQTKIVDGIVSSLLAWYGVETN